MGSSVQLRYQGGYTTQHALKVEEHLIEVISVLQFVLQFWRCFSTCLRLFMSSWVQISGETSYTNTSACLDLWCSSFSFRLQGPSLKAARWTFIRWWRTSNTLKILSHTPSQLLCIQNYRFCFSESRSPLTLSHFLKNSSSLIILDTEKLEWLSPVSSFSQDRDFCLLHPGDPVFLSFSGETLRYKGKEALYPFFVNECAFYETGVALSLARRRKVEIPDIQCSRTWRAYSREKDEK